MENGSFALVKCGAPQKLSMKDEKSEDESPNAEDGSTALCDKIIEVQLVEDKYEENTQYAADKGSESIFLKKDNLMESIHSSPELILIQHPKKKLLILDINGLLADIARREIFKRPFCSDFLNFCFNRFDVGIWTSRTKKNMDRVINSVMGDMKHKLLFCWDASHCTETGFSTLENKHKPLVFKELRKLWEEHDPNLPWEKGYYNESNTLLVDDSPYKALLNPPHTAIFPYSYKFQDMSDNSLGIGGSIRVYLEELHSSENVQNYVEHHPFGQSPISERNPSWGFYRKVTISLFTLRRANSINSTSFIDPPGLQADSTNST